MSCATPLRLRSLLLPLLALAALPAIRAQSEGPGRPATELSLRSRLISRSDLGAGGASVSQSSVGFAAEVPFPIAGGVNGKLGASLDLFELDFAAFDRTPPGIARPLSRGRVATLAPSLNFSPADKVFVFAGPQWELSAASGADTGGAVQWSGTVGAVWLFRPGLTLVGGFVFSERLGYSTRYLPIAGFNWQIDDTWSLALTGSAADYQAPVLKLAYALNPSTKLFAQVGFENGHLRLAGDSSIPHGYLRYEAFVPQIGADWRISPGVELSVFTGAQLNQKYDFKNQARQYVYRETADGAWVAGLRLNGRF